MTIQQAKAIPLDELLQQLGYQLQHERSGRKWYKYRQEKTASFVLSKNGYAWFDHGSGQGGNIIDFAQMEGQCTTVSDALAWLEQVMGHGDRTSSPIYQRPRVTPEPPAYSVDAVSQASDARGICWLASRSIDYAPVQPYLKDVYFNKVDKPAQQSFYGIGLENRAGGYEVRSQLNGIAWQKTSVGPKDITAFNLNPGGTWFTFEGLPDFCTFLTLKKPEYGLFNFLILNGTGLTGRAIAYFQQQPPTRVTICSQAGVGGQQSKRQLSQWLTENGVEGSDMDEEWQGFEDYNAKRMSDQSVSVVGEETKPKRGLRATPKLKW